MSSKSNNIKVIVPFYNPGVFLDNCVASVMSQKYDNFQVIFVDDCSTDGSFEKLPDDSRCIKIRNTVRKTALENLHNAIMDYCDPNDICVTVDGDDWLSSKNVLSYINEQYNTHDCWVMYGNATWTDGRRGFASAYSPEEFRNVRKAPFRVSHIRTFRAGVYHKILEQDPTFSCLKDSGGNFYRSSYDTAMMFPIMELAGLSKILFNDTILYVYNRNNPISDDKVDQALQTSVHVEVSNKKPLKQIISYE